MFLCLCVEFRKFVHSYYLTEKQNCRKIHCNNISVYFEHKKKYHENFGKKVGARPDCMNGTMKVRELKKYMKVKLFITTHSATYSDRIVQEVSM